MLVYQTTAAVIENDFVTDLANILDKVLQLKSGQLAL